MSTTLTENLPAHFGSDPPVDLRESVRSAMHALPPVQAVAQQVESGKAWDAQVWSGICSELRWCGLGIAAEYGGTGGGSTEVGIALEESGKVLYNGPYLASAAIAAGVLTLCGDAQASARWLPGIASGTVVATLAGTEQQLWPLADTLVTTARGAPAECSVRGKKVAVVAGVGADLFLVTAVDDDGVPVIVAVPAADPAVHSEAEPVMDLTRRLSTVTFSDSPGRIVHTVRDMPSTMSAITNLRGSMLASEQAGAARAVVDLTVDYARERVQFGREIGSFQAVRHRLADMHAEVEVATAIARSAAACPSWFGDDTTALVSAAQSFCSETFMWVSEEAMQLHGGIGFTWEHPVGLYFKRAKSSEILLGDPAEHRARLYSAMFEVSGEQTR